MDLLFLLTLGTDWFLFVIVDFVAVSIDLSPLGTCFFGGCTLSTLKIEFVTMCFVIDLVTLASGSLYSRLSVGYVMLFAPFKLLYSHLCCNCCWASCLALLCLSPRPSVPTPAWPLVFVVISFDQSRHVSDCDHFFVGRRFGWTCYALVEELHSIAQSFAACCFDRSERQSKVIGNMQQKHVKIENVLEQAMAVMDQTTSKMLNYR